MASVEELQQIIQTRASEYIVDMHIQCGQLTVRVKPEHLKELVLFLRDDTELQFDELIDVCGVDYLTYGMSEWVTDQATGTGFERAANRKQEVRELPPMPERFAAVYHLLSVALNHRVRLKAFLDENFPAIDSIVEIWPAANWFEREAFDLYGILFKGHPDLRRILTDYGFIGHPFRKDFPLIGNVEMRYDATQGRVVYEPVSIRPRILVPRVIREDSRYADIDPPQGNKN